MAFGRCGTVVEVFEGRSSGSIVALRLRLRGEGAPGCIADGAERPSGCDVTDALLFELP